jgi:hypothetical protein
VNDGVHTGGEKEGVFQKLTGKNQRLVKTYFLRLEQLVRLSLAKLPPIYLLHSKMEALLTPQGLV